MRLFAPHYFVAYLIVTIILHRWLPVTGVVPDHWKPAGLVFVLLGGLFIAWGGLLLRVRGTAVRPFETPRMLVTDGPFRVSRNPIYLGFVLVLLGVAVALGSLTAFIAPLAMFATLQIMLIPHEERSLMQAFGQAYTAYRQRVRRWL